MPSKISFTYTKNLDTFISPTVSKQSLRRIGVLLPLIMPILLCSKDVAAQKSDSIPLPVFTLVDTFPYGPPASPFSFFGGGPGSPLAVLQNTASGSAWNMIGRDADSLDWQPVASSIQFEKSTTYWFRLSLYNPFDREEEAWMWVWNRGWDSIRTFLPTVNGYEEQRIDPAQAPGNKDLPYWMPFFRIKMQPGDTSTVFLQMHSISPNFLAGRVLPPRVVQVDGRSFNRKLPFRTYYTGIIHGFLVIQFLFFAIIYLITRDRTVLYLAVFLAGYALYDLHESIFKEEFNLFYWGYESYWAIFLRFPATLIFGYGLMKFASTYVDLPSVYPDLPRWINIFMGCFVVISVLAYLDENTVYPIEGIFVFQLYRLCAFLFFLFVITAPLLALYHRKPYARLLLVGIAPIPLAGFVGIFMVVGLLPTFMPYRDIFRIGTALSMILLSVGVGYRINTLRRREDELKKTQEIDAIKTRFYTNITHEFRTPLTVIQGTTEQIAGHPTERAIIQRNSRNLLRLVNRMLDLSKLEAGKLPLRPVHGDVLAFLRYVTESFHSLALNQKINLNFHSEEPVIEMDYDPEKVLEVLSNLISNALKFTAEYGKVTITARKRATAEGEYLEFKVKDTGTGIDPSRIPHIFDRFYQADDSNTRRAEGTGIGLALTQELIDLMSGTIQVESEVGVGTTFTVSLPIRKEAPAVEQLTEVYSEHAVESIAPEDGVVSLPLAGEGEVRVETPLLLVVEDNYDVRQYLASCLREDYQLLFARNGREGIDIALERIPDIIISDVMMPEVDGYELCRTIKQDERTSHVPIILLTAKADRTSKIEGLEYGADAYLTKPFHQSELDVRLRKLIALRQQLQARYSRMEFEQDVEPHREDAFVLRVRQLVLDHLDDGTFDVEALSRALHLHRSQVHRKLKALTGKSASHFVRQIRLGEGHRLLKRGELNVSEVAYAVGFSDPSYFSKLFSQEYGHPPSAL